MRDFLETALKDPEQTAVAFFNYAHSYAQSAVTLEDYPTNATHDDAPIYFLYFHATELYLKSYLVVHGWSLTDLRDKFGHKVVKLVDQAKSDGLVIIQEDKDVFRMMDQTDNVISSRYIRVGHHIRLRIPAHFDTCKRLHDQIGPRVYRDSGVSRIPILRDKRETTGHS